MQRPLTAETLHVLAQNQQQVPAGTVATSVFALIFFGGLIWYCKKHKGYDWPQMMLGGAFVIVLAAIPFGGQLVNGIAGGLFSVLNGLGSVLS